MAIEDIDKTEDLSLDDIKEELGDFKTEVNKEVDENKKIEEWAEEWNSLYWIPKNVGLEYWKLLKTEIKRQEKLGYEDSNSYFLNELWFGDLHFPELWELSELLLWEWFMNCTWIILFYIQKLCPENFENIANLMLSNPCFAALMTPAAEGLSSTVWKVGDDSYTKQMIRFIEKNGESSYKYLKLCSSFKLTRELDNPDLTFWVIQETQRQWLDMFTIFFENFINEPEYTNLLQYLEWNPQKLSNLGWKVVKEIDLDIDSWINFAFRGIIEMVKSRPDIDFPHLNENASESEKDKRSQEWERIIKEYESMLRNYISKDFLEWDKDSEKKDNEKPFDKVFYATQYWDIVLDSIPTPKNWTKNFTWNEVSDYSSGWKPVDKWPDTLSIPSTENPIKWTGIEKEYEELDSDKKMLFNSGIQEIEKWWYIYKMESWNIVRQRISEDLDTSPMEVFVNNELKWREMIADIKKYVKEHPQEKILVCVEHHWGQDWSSGNGWSKQDWMELANLSPNVKIWSIRCYFWNAFTNEEIYDQQSPLSWFSNSSITMKYVSNAVNEGLKKWLWFNELEIYTRLNYQESVTPLTENMEYTNWETWETETWKIWIAQNVKNENNGPDEYYA